MIRATGAPLDDATIKQLKAWQQGVDDAGDYAARVRAAEQEFTRRRPQSGFRPVIDALIAMCTGRRRCMYCEDSCAEQVEHHHPKAYYPELVFAWSNFLFACSGCNGRKSSTFPLFSPAAPTVVEFSHKGDDERSPPPAGTSVLLDPRQDDPQNFFRLDLRGTFKLNIVPTPGSHEHLRAERTLRVLKLNHRDELLKHRRDIYESQLSHLHRAASARQDPARSTEVERIKLAVQGLSCGVVWREMKRQREVHPELVRAFGAIPEALDW